MNNTPTRSLIALAVALAAASTTGATTVYEKDGKKIEVGGRIQLEYVNISPDCSPGTPCYIDDSGTLSELSFDRLFFRRLRPYLAGTLYEHWSGKIEFDFGEAEDSDEIQVKDAYFAYTGFGGVTRKLYVGNAKTVFSREFLTTSAELELVERGFTGDHNVGVPDRALGVRWDAHALEGKLAWAANVGAEHHDPAVNRMDFDSPVNNQGDWNEGLVVAARVDWYPMQPVAFSEGDLDRGKSRIAVGLGAFTWSNDGDNNSYTDANGNATNPDKPDLDEANGLEVSFAYRGHGGSVDAEWQVVNGDTVDPNFTGGLYLDGTTRLKKVSLVGGYLVWREKIEVVLGFDRQDADNYEAVYRRSTVGVNWYLHGHKIKVQANYRRVQDFIGLDGQTNNVFFGSTQFVF